jgi:hypothetical protein
MDPDAELFLEWGLQELSFVSVAAEDESAMQATISFLESGLLTPLGSSALASVEYKSEIVGYWRSLRVSVPGCRI